MTKPFKHLIQKLSPKAQKAIKEKTDQLLAGMRLDIVARFPEGEIHINQFREI